jgi:predicted DNA-binding transcriptional regulator YafY
MQRVFTDPRGWSFDGMRDTLGITTRTLQRYSTVFAQELVDGDGRPLLEVVRQGSRAVLRRADYTAAPSSTVFQLLSLYLAYTVIQFLQDTVIKQGVADLWDRLHKVLPVAERDRLRDFTKKFYSVPYAVKEYSGYDETIDAIVQCLVYQCRARIEYGPVDGGTSAHEFEPYTLAMYRGGLYLIGKSSRGRKVITLAVERIRSIQRLKEKFAYPKTYSPEKFTEGVFGIITGGEETAIELEIRNPVTLTYLKSRKMHPTQQFEERSDGAVHLKMTVRGTDELRNWILSYGPWMKVLRPEKLRDEVATRLAEASALYQMS